MNVKKINLHRLYLNALINTIPDSKDNIKKSIIYGVRLIGTLPKDEKLNREELENKLQIALCIKDLMGKLTPREMENLFPIKKDFDGHKYQMKDYFHTKKHIESLPDEPLGNIESVSDFLWEYMNRDLMSFGVKVFGFMSDIRRLDGHMGLMEEWASKNGIKTYTMHTDGKGKKYLIDPDSGKTMRIKRKMPRYLKLVK